MINTDPMAFFIRDHAAWLRKSQKKRNRGETYGAPEPSAPYAELIRSRYPTFTDAVRDLDDGLTTVALFAQMSGTKLVASERLVKCRRLLAEFHYCIARTRTLNLGFISFRGFHFQATLEGTKVLWLIPHNFPLAEDAEVDYRVLLEFLELYEHLVGFVNARLFIQLGMKYPPVFDRRRWDASFYIESIIDTFPQDATEAPPEQQQPSEGLDRMVRALTVPDGQSEDVDMPEEPKTLFGTLVFTIHHGVARDPVSFVIKALGGRVEWDEDSDDPAITHTVIDRAVRSRHLSRVYVQPQWVFDCLNKRMLLPIESAEGSYVPGQNLPPHLSPFEAVQEEPMGVGEIDEREMVAAGAGSDADIDEEVRRVALEADYAEGIARETGQEADGERRPAITDIRTKLKQQQKEERERLAAGQLTSAKRKLYNELKEKEEQRQRAKQPPVPIDELTIDEDAMEEEEEEEEEAEDAE
jgi:pescadillo protein